jgi:hypothetical protein
MSNILDWESSATADPPWSTDEAVTLPGRYQVESDDNHLLDPEFDKTTNSGHHDADDLDTREKDLGDALKWIRQEIVSENRYI